MTKNTTFWQLFHSTKDSLFHSTGQILLKTDCYKRAIGELNVINLFWHVYNIPNLSFQKSLVSYSISGEVIFSHNTVFKSVQKLYYIILPTFTAILKWRHVYLCKKVCYFHCLHGTLSVNKWCYENGNRIQLINHTVFKNLKI